MNQATTMYIVRHGQVDNPGEYFYGRERDLALAPRGFEQVRAIAAAIRRSGDLPAVLYSSPLLRTRQTAETIRTALPGDTPIILRDELLETDTKGLGGRPLAWLRQVGDPYALKQKDYTIETPESIRERMTAILIASLDQYAGQVICHISHGDPIAFLMDALLHPHVPVRPILELHDVFLQQGEAWRVRLDSGYRVISYEKITGQPPA